MTRRFLFVMDPLEHILPDKDTTFVFMLESRQRAHGVYVCGIGDLFLANGVPWARTRRADVARADPHYALFEERTECLHWFDVVGLSRRILRAETAAMVAVTLAQFLWGDLASQT